MYIPTWIFIGLIIALFVYLSKNQKNSTLNSSNDSTANNQDFSYKLTISLQPNWYKILQKLYNPKSDKEWEEIQKKIEKIKKDPDP